MQASWARSVPGFSIAGILFCLLLAACGGGGGGSPTASDNGGTSVPSGLSYPTPQAFTVEAAIAPVAPTVTGTVASYAVNPALPAGLKIDANTGILSGTPTTVTAQAKYTVTATNSGGSATADILIAVNDVPPAAFTYAAPTVALATGVPIASLSPKQSPAGGATTSWSINAALPAGLSFSTTDGTISGTPTVDSSATPYTISASNSGGQQTYVLTLSVQSGVVLDLGHTDRISVLRFDGTYVFSMDTGAHWVLWNYATGASIASGDAKCATCQSGSMADFAGQTIAIQTGTGFELRSPVDGHVTATITTAPPPWWKLATDGSYLVAGNAAGGLQIWSVAGVSLLSKAQGGYGADNVFAAPGHLQAAIPVGGSNVVETTSIATGVSSNSPSFAGKFSVWFVDGNRFLSVSTDLTSGTPVSTVYTYSATAVQDDATTIQALGTLQGAGNWFGSFLNSTLNVYKVGASSMPTASFPADNGFTASHTMFIATASPAGAPEKLTFIDLSGAAPVEVDPALPLGYGPPVYSVFAALSATQWVGGTSSGVLLDGASPVLTPRYFDYGAAWSIAGSGTRFAIATASGRVLHFDTATKTLEGTIQTTSTKVQLSTDGTVLAALGSYLSPAVATVPDLHKTRVYSLPGDGLLGTWPANNVDQPPSDIDLSGSGTLLGQVFKNSSGGTAAAYPVTGGAAIWSNVGDCGEIRVSPDATHIACPKVTGPLSLADSVTKLFNSNGNAAIASVDGLALGWLDDGHLLANLYNMPALAVIASNGNAIYSPTGTVLGTANLPDLHDVQVVTADSVYSPALNSILSVSGGASTWVSADPSQGVGAVAGSNVIFASGTKILALSH